MHLADRLPSQLLRVFTRPDQKGGDRPAHEARQHPQLLEVDKWSASECVLRLTRIVGHNPYPLDELMLMAAAFEYHRPDLVIDIGTHVGKSARIWFELARWHHVPASVHTIDLCEPSHVEYPGRQLGRYIRGLPVHQHIGDGAACARDIINSASAESTFLLFLDGDHSYETVRRELRLGEMIRRGCLLVHDTFCQPGSQYNHGPYLAIQDSLGSLCARQVVHLQTGLPGMSYLGIEKPALE